MTYDRGTYGGANPADGTTTAGGCETTGRAGPEVVTAAGGIGLIRRVIGGMRMELVMLMGERSRRDTFRSLPNQKMVREGTLLVSNEPAFDIAGAERETPWDWQWPPN